MRHARRFTAQGGRADGAGQSQSPARNVQGRGARARRAELKVTDTRAALAADTALISLLNLRTAAKAAIRAGLLTPPPTNFVAPELPEDVQTLTDAVTDAEATERAARRTAGTEEGLAVWNRARAQDSSGEAHRQPRHLGGPAGRRPTEGLTVDTVKLDDTTPSGCGRRSRRRRRTEAAQRELECVRTEHTRLQVSCQATSSSLESSGLQALRNTAESLERRRALVRGRLALLPAGIEFARTQMTPPSISCDDARHAPRSSRGD